MQHATRGMAQTDLALEQVVAANTSLLKVWKTLPCFIKGSGIFCLVRPFNEIGHIRTNFVWEAVLKR